MKQKNMTCNTKHQKIVLSIKLRNVYYERACVTAMTVLIIFPLTYSRPVFFNLFAAAEPYVSVTITHGTPCNDKRVQRCRQSGIFGVSGDWCPQRVRKQNL